MIACLSFHLPDLVLALAKVHLPPALPCRYEFCFWEGVQCSFLFWGLWCSWAHFWTPSAMSFFISLIFQLQGWSMWPVYFLDPNWRKNFRNPSTVSAYFLPIFLLYIFLAACTQRTRTLLLCPLVFLLYMHAYMQACGEKKNRVRHEIQVTTKGKENAECTCVSTLLRTSNKFSWLGGKPSNSLVKWQVELASGNFLIQFLAGFGLILVMIMFRFWSAWFCFIAHARLHALCQGPTVWAGVQSCIPILSVRDNHLNRGSKNGQLWDDEMEPETIHDCQLSYQVHVFKIWKSCYQYRGQKQQLCIFASKESEVDKFWLGQFSPLGVELDFVSLSKSWTQEKIWLGWTCPRAKVGLGLWSKSWTWEKNWLARTLPIPWVQKFNFVLVKMCATGTFQYEGPRNLWKWIRVFITCADQEEQGTNVSPGSQSEKPRFFQNQIFDANSEIHQTNSLAEM